MKQPAPQCDQRREPQPVNVAGGVPRLAAGNPFEPGQPGNEQRRSGKHHRVELGRDRGKRVREDQFIGDGQNDDPRDNRNMPIGERLPRDQPRHLVLFDVLRAALCPDIEIEPPHRKRTQESVQQRQIQSGLPLGGRIGCAGDHQPFAQRDDDEQPAALGHMATRDGPILNA